MKSPIDPNMQLSEHFTLKEMIYSRTAASHQPRPLPNIPLKCHITALENLCRYCLEPTRQHFGLPIQVTSGYRCEAVNRLVGGVANSQHIDGEAADITIPRSRWPFCYTTSEQIARLLFMWMKDNIDFDQLILEHSGSTWWVHVSCRVDRRRNRHQIINELTKN